LNRLVKGYVKDKEGAERARRLLESDQDLFDEVLSAVVTSQTALDRMTTAVQLLHTIRSRFPSMTTIPISELYVKTLGGDLQDSPALKETLLTLKKSSSNQLQELLWAIRDFVIREEAPQLKEFDDELESLLREASAPLRSQYDVQNQTLRTTVVAQKVELSKQKAKVTEQDAAYSELLDSIHDWISTHLAKYLLSADDVLFSEVFVYDGRGPDRAAFMPRHRQAIERALSSPHDYLNCDCCQIDAQQHTEEASQSNRQPFTHSHILEYVAADSASHGIVVPVVPRIWVIHQRQ
jgi:origin recognition complex subunit 3